MTTSVIKQVKKLAGGIDEYLLTTSNEGLLYPKAIKLKKNMARLVRVRERDAAIATLSEGGNATATSSETAAIVGVPGRLTHPDEAPLKPSSYACVSCQRDICSRLYHP